MLVYNVTIKVDHAIAGDWQFWMLREHIPMLLATNCFFDAKFFRLLDQDDTDGPTFCAQYYCHARADYDRYIDEYADQMRNETKKIWANQLVAFRSLMELRS